MKRFQAVSLILVAGAGATALGLGWLDPSQREEDALIYRSEAECVSRRERSEADCRSGFAEAERAALATAPRYADKPTCERHHSWANCRPASPLAGSPGGPEAFMPLMAAYMLGRTPEQRLPVQPLYNHQPEDEPQTQTAGSGGHGGGYCTGGGGRVYAARTGGVSTVSSSVARSTVASPRVVSRGGFGFTGTAMAAHSSGSAAHGIGHASSGS